jgi:hypothetical protein
VVVANLQRLLKMNLRQTTIIWITLTVLVPSIYFTITCGIEVEDLLQENLAVRENRVLRPGDGLHTYLVVYEKDGEEFTSEIKSDHCPRSDEEIVKLIAAGRLLSKFEAKAWREKEELEKKRRLFWEAWLTLIFGFVSLSSVLIYRSKTKLPTQSL